MALAAGFSLFSLTHSASAQEDSASAAPAVEETAEAMSPELAAQVAQFEQLIKSTKEYVAASDAAEEGEEVAWDSYVSGDPSELWGLIHELNGNGDLSIGDELNSLSEAENNAIYDNVWSASDQLTPWLTHNIWVLIAAALVFIMHLGFASLESGLCQKKNTVNIIFKNVWIISTGILIYFLWGFNAHYPCGAWSVNDIFAFGSSAEYAANQKLTMATNLYHDSYTWWTDFIFQAMFAATAATIVSGAVAERVKLGSFMIYSVLLVGVAYPIAGAWHWGGGFLANLSTGAFYDFAGSTVVHAFGAAAALAAVIVLGPRKGKYVDGRIKPILPHSTPLAAIGVFLLFLGWFGFNGGSVLAAEPHLVSLVFTTTALAACGGAVSAIAVSWGVLKKPDVSMALNGLLAGLVGITAGADSVTPTNAIIIGLIAGVIVVFSILFFDKMKIDDPVGAIAVHGSCGIWGTLAVAIFGEGFSIVSQLIGIASVCGFAFLFSLIVFLILKVTLGVRVNGLEEEEGLDVAEHGSPAYND